MCLKPNLKNGFSNKVKMGCLIVVNDFYCVFNAFDYVFWNFECVLNWFQMSLKWVSMNCKCFIMSLNDFTTVLDRNVVACLRRAEFRYTAILSKAISDHFFFVFGDAILGTQRYFSNQFKVEFLKWVPRINPFFYLPPRSPLPKLPPLEWLLWATPQEPTINQTKHYKHTWVC